MPSLENPHLNGLELTIDTDREKSEIFSDEK